MRILAVKLQEALIEEERRETVVKPVPVTAILSPNSVSELLADSSSDSRWFSYYKSFKKYLIIIDQSLNQPLTLTSFLI